MASATDKKIEKLYAGLGEKERVRMLAKLAREHKPAEMDKLRNATPEEHADAYNHALKLLRVLNGNLLDWIALFRTSMERDRMRLQAFFQVAALKDRITWQLAAMWQLIPYPVTESEYREIVKREREKLTSLDGYAEYLAETTYDTDEPGLHPKIAELLDTLPPKDGNRDEQTSELHTITRVNIHAVEHDAIKKGEIPQPSELAKRIRTVIDDAIEAGELPKPTRKDGELWLPNGVLSDWGQGTTPDTYELYGPGLHVPMLRPFQGELAAEWDIRPNSEAEAVKERRRQLYLFLPVPPDISEELRGLVRNLEPPLTEKELERDEKLADEIQAAWYSSQGLAKLMYDAAVAHADSRYQLAGVREALAIIQERDFYGEDPLWPEIRAQLDATQNEANRFPSLWEHVNEIDTSLREALYKLQGLEPPAWKSDDWEKPAPIPEKEPNTEEMLQLIRGWGG